MFEDAQTRCKLEASCSYQRGCFLADGLFAEMVRQRSDGSGEQVALCLATGSLTRQIKCVCNLAEA